MERSLNDRSIKYIMQRLPRQVIMIKIKLLINLFLFNCITGVGDDYWNDCCRQKNEEKRNYNNPTGRRSCVPLETCQSKCYKTHTGGNSADRRGVSVVDSPYTVHVRNCEKECRDKVFCEIKSSEEKEIK